VLPVEDVNAEDVVGRLRSLAPRLLVVVAFGQYLRKPVREIAPLGGVNLHYSLLPRWGGAAPVQRALLAGDAVTGACVQRVAARLDAGPVLARREVAIGPRDDTLALRARLTAAGAPLLVETATRLLAGETLPEETQDEARVTHAAPVARAEGDLDFAVEDAAALDRRIRALEPWPRCRARLVRAADPAGALDVVLREASPEEGSGAPGEVVAAGPDGIRVAARGGVLRITRLQRAGGRDVDARAFLNGLPTGIGDRFERPG
jgi:methionyl-tRNA formyltransferase